VEYKRGLLLVREKQDYQKLATTINNWSEMNAAMTDPMYKNLVDEKKFNFYEGFSDSMSELRINEFEESQTTIFDRLDSMMPEESNLMQVSEVPEENFILDDPDFLAVTMPLMKKNKKKPKKPTNIDLIPKILAAKHILDPTPNESVSSSSLQRTGSDLGCSNPPKKKNPRKKKTRRDKKLKELDTDIAIDLEMPKNFDKPKISLSKTFHYVNLPHGVYYGEFKAGKISGVGKFKGLNGDRYTGDWKDGKFGGDGKIMRKNGAWYSGGFKDGDYSGFGKGLDVYGGDHWYQGDLLDGMKHGKGERHQGRTYWKGEWKNDKMDGGGEWRCVNGSSYTGQWANGMFSGEGVYKSKDLTYSGSWVNNERHGKGTEHSADG
jgi:hypothetical protein